MVSVYSGVPESSYLEAVAKGLSIIQELTLDPVPLNAPCSLRVLGGADNLLLLGVLRVSKADCGLYFAFYNLKLLSGMPDGRNRPKLICAHDPRVHF